MHRWRILDGDVFRWKDRQWPDFFYLAVTNEESIKCFYIIWKATFSQRRLKKIHRKIGTKIRKILFDHQMKVQLFRIETFFAGYRVQRGQIRLFEQDGRECLGIPSFLQKMFGGISSMYQALRRPDKVA